MVETPLIPPPAIAQARANGKIPFGFGARFFVATVLGLAWLVPAWWMPRLIVAMFLWDALLALAWLWDLQQLPRAGQLELRRLWSLRPALSVPGAVTIELRNSGKLPIHARIVDETPPQLRLEPPTLELFVRSGRVSTIQYAILPSERGDVALGRTFVRYQSAMHLAERWAVAETSQVVCVLPNVEEAKKHTLYLIRSRQVELEKRRRHQRGLGREFDSMRDYREGDEIRDISWTATARRNHLVTRVFQIERSQAVWLVLDAGRLLRAKVQEPGRELRLSKLDYAVTGALSLAQVAIHCGDRVGLLAYGRRIQQNVNAARGVRQVRAILESLARVKGEALEADHGRAAHTLLTTQRRRSLVVWLTDFAETATTPDVIEYALHLTSRHLVLFAAMAQPDLNAVAAAAPQSKDEMYRHAAALEIAQRRDLLLRGLRQRGVLTLEVMPEMLASSMVNQYLDIKERNLL
jgi:uncharacterized protein (DUF58 family)